MNLTTSLRSLVQLAATSFLVASASGLELERHRYCGMQGVWLQTLGSGGLEFKNKRLGASYLIWNNDDAVALIDAGDGAKYAFGEAGAKFEDLKVILVTRGTLDRISGLPAFLASSMRASRSEPLTLLGPEGNDNHLGIEKRLQGLMGNEGAWSEHSESLSRNRERGEGLRVREVRAIGNRTWSQAVSPGVSVAALPVYHAGIPSVAWRVEVAEKSVVFAGSSNNQKDTLSEFAKGADALVLSHQLRDSDVGPRTAKFVPPTRIGRIAHRAGVRFIVLGDRGGAAYGLELSTRDRIESEFNGTIIFADDLECWGL